MIKDSLDDSYHVNMLINLLLRFPEIYTITFNVPSSSCRLSYMIKRNLDQKEYQDLRQRLQEYLRAFYFLNNCEDTCRFELLRNRYPGLTQIQIILTGDSQLSDVISLLTKTVKDFFNVDLIDEIRQGKDSGWPEAALPVEDLPGRFPSTDPNRKISHLFAFREAGKVYVFDK